MTCSICSKVVMQAGFRIQESEDRMPLNAGMQECKMHDSEVRRTKNDD
jgi:hypothetical protein